MSFFKYLLNTNSELSAFIFIDNYLKIVNSSLDDIRKRFFSNLSVIQFPFNYLIDKGDNLTNRDWFLSLMKKTKIEYENQNWERGRRICCEFRDSELGRDILILTRGHEVVCFGRSLFYNSDKKQACMSLFEDKDPPLYNYMDIENKRDKNIVICERFDWIHGGDANLREDFPDSIFTWLNPDKKISNRNWCSLVNRNVIFVLQENSGKFVARAGEIYRSCLERKIQPNIFTYYKKDVDGVSYKWHKGEKLKVEELRNLLCVNNVGSFNNKSNTLDVLKIKKPSELRTSSNKTEYLVKKLFKSGEIVLLVAKQKVGKSLFALDLSIMLATGGAMGDCLSIPKPQKVLYIDAEMPEEEVGRRIDTLSINYKHPNRIIQNLGFYFPQEEGECLNLLSNDDQSLLERSLKGYKLLVLDNLGKMLPSRGEMNEGSWRIFFKWLEKISSKGITVLLVHHENKVGEHRGTGKITDDVDLVLSLKKIAGREEDSSAIKLTIEDSRFLYGNDCSPFVLEYCKDKRLVYSLEREEKKKQLSNKVNFSKVDAYLVEKGFAHHSLKKEHKIILAPLCAGQAYVVRKDFDGLFGIQDRSLQNLFKEICEYGILSKEGIGKATKYTLAYPATL